MPSCTFRDVKMTLFALAAVFLKYSQVTYFPCGIISAGETYDVLECFEYCCMFLCSNNDQTRFSDMFTSAGPRGKCWNPEMLMHRKSCLNPYNDRTQCTSHFKHLHNDTRKRELLWNWVQGDHPSKNIFSGCSENPSQILILDIIKHNFWQNLHPFDTHNNENF